MQQKSNGSRLLTRAGQNVRIGSDETIVLDGQDRESQQKKSGKRRRRKQPKIKQFQLPVMGRDNFQSHSVDFMGPTFRAVYNLFGKHKASNGVPQDGVIPGLIKEAAYGVAYLAREVFIPPERNRYTRRNWLESAGDFIFNKSTRRLTNGFLAFARASNRIFGYAPTRQQVAELKQTLKTAKRYNEWAENNKQNISEREYNIAANAFENGRQALRHFNAGSPLHFDELHRKAREGLEILEDGWELADRREASLKQERRQVGLTKPIEPEVVLDNELEKKLDQSVDGAEVADRDAEIQQVAEEFKDVETFLEEARAQYGDLAHEVSSLESRRDEIQHIINNMPGQIIALDKLVKVRTKLLVSATVRVESLKTMTAKEGNAVAARYDKSVADLKAAQSTLKEAQNDMPELENLLRQKAISMEALELHIAELEEELLPIEPETIVEADIKLDDPVLERLHEIYVEGPKLVEQFESFSAKNIEPKRAIEILNGLDAIEDAELRESVGETLREYYAGVIESQIPNLTAIDGGVSEPDVSGDGAKRKGGGTANLELVAAPEPGI
jgi:hypothetical protein